MPDLSGLPALDLAIGLSFIFLLLSLLAAAVQELIAAVLALRAATLEKGLRNMLAPETGDDPPPSAEKIALPEGGVAEPAAEEGLDTRFYKHPLIRPLYKQHLLASVTDRGRFDRPSYISPRSFALALIDTVAPDAALHGESGVVNDTDVLRAIRTKIVASGLPDQVKYSLITTLDNARGDLDAFRQGLENWFDDTMARVSGWYKRKTQLILLLIAIVVTLAMNVNTITIADRLWKDPAVRAAIVAQATSSETLKADEKRPKGERTPGLSAATERFNRAGKDVDDVAALGAPIGWAQNHPEDPRHVSLKDALFRHLGGWLLTIMAMSLGAPFWFDVLSRLSRLRSSGKPEAPLPASSLGKANERVPTVRPPNVATPPRDDSPSGETTS